MQLVQYLYVEDNAVVRIDPNGELGLLAGTVIATAASALVAGATSAYQSYKKDSRVNWRQAGKAAVGGAVAAISVGVAVATGGTSAGVGVMAAAIAGVGKALHGGTAADVAHSMGKTSVGALAAGKVLSAAPKAAKFIAGSSGTIAGISATVQNVKTTSKTFKDKNATPQQKIAATFDTVLSVGGTIASAGYAVQNAPASIKRPISYYLEKFQCAAKTSSSSAKIQFPENPDDFNPDGLGLV